MPRKTRKLDEYPSIHLQEKDWLVFLKTDNGEAVMGKILYDIYDELLAQEEKEAGTLQPGRRKLRSGIAFSELMEKILGPQKSTDPFPEALRTLIGKRSQSQFALKVPLDQSTLSRYLSGQKKPSIGMMEQIAKAAKIHPSYFHEWRAHMLSHIVLSVMLDSPNVSIKLSNRFSSQYKANK